MRKLKLILSIFIFILTISCQRNIDLNSDKLLTETFNATEIKSLESMINFVDKMVVDRIKKTDINKAYHLFFEQMSSATKDGSTPTVTFEKKEKSDLLERIDTTAFSAIWTMDSYVRMKKSQDTILTNTTNYGKLHFNLTGRYMDYLKKLGQTDEFFYKLHNTIEVAGDLPVGLAVWFPENNSKFDFNIVKNRLWAVIYILRIEKTIGPKLK